MALDRERHRYRYVGSKFVDEKDPSKGLTYDLNATSDNINAETPADTSTAPTYSTWANYIIFRNINLENEEWTPLMFSGHMEGRLNMSTGEDSQVTIENINVVPAADLDGILDPKDKLDTSVNIGIGFFGTISNQVDENNFGLSGGTAEVKNIKLSTIRVENPYDEIVSTDRLISGVLNLVGGLLGVVGGVLQGILSLSA